eukprot:TRINITY_DN1832_c0_g1_i1.p1 TRINITY_DN1832_c0_g1~~TRINITY_DN1832_c0_g1_i1.p1  ORF type:complete len:1559 (-),score=294.89 TRINITY_DN1832_c0_g1_i1:30-4664(-)
MTDTAHTFIKSSLALISKKVGRRQGTLKNSCKTAIEVLDKMAQSGQNGESKLVPYVHQILLLDEVPIEEISEHWDYLINVLVDPLQLACETRDTNQMAVALDCFQKLLSYGYIQRFTPDKLERVVDNYDGFLITRVIDVITKCFKYSDKRIQLQIIKALTPAVTLPLCGVHGSNLMESIRTCYNIYLMTRENKIRNVAKGTLDHMLTVIFQRLETEEPNEIIQKEIESNTEEEEVSEESDVESVDPFDIVNNILWDIVDEVVENNNGSNGSVQYIRSVSSTSMSEDISISEEIEEETAYNDCVIVFRGLCKLANKELPEGSLRDSRHLKSKIFSLELLLSIIDQSRSVLKNHTKFIHKSIKKYLCICLSNNSTSEVPKVFQLSLSIFLILSTQFKEHLKVQLIAFYDLFLHILESSHSSIQQKWMVVNVLHKICKDPQTLVDLYVNYDCDMSNSNIFGQLVNVMSRLVQPAPITEVWTIQHQQLKTLSLECLVTISDSLVKWSNEIYEPPIERIETDEVEDEEVVATPRYKAPNDKFVQQKERKTLVEKGVSLFNLSIKKGILFLIEENIIENTPSSIAQFLRHTEELDVVKIGEYLGSAKNIEVMYAYVDEQNDFTGLELDAAIRKFLFPFKIGGEAQQIDRLMEKFAYKYFLDNPDSFIGSAEGVYVLSFAIMMLATDLHSSSITDKIPVDKWKRNIYEYEELQHIVDEDLNNIYDRMGSEPLKVRGGLFNTSLGKNSGFTSEKEKRIAFKEETAVMVQSALDKINSSRDSVYFRVTNIGYVIPMFEAAWCPILAGFSICLEESEDMSIVTTCMNGFKAAIRLCSIFYLDVERDAFMSALAKFTSLENLQIMTEKHIEAIRTLIQIASTDGNYLQSSWSLVLKCISQIERMQNWGSGGKVDDSLGEESLSERRASGNVNTIMNTNSMIIAANIPAQEIDMIFSNSTMLANHSILDLVSALCIVSKEELSMKNPRIFSLQKMVELTYYNMSCRIRIVWTQIWKLLSDHFTYAGCHKNKRVAIFALDSLRQLSVKFLSKEELSNYHFQSNFLMPFEVISKTKSSRVRSYVVECMCTFVHGLAMNIKSGWCSILKVFAFQASIPDNIKIIRTSYEMIEVILQEKFHFVKDSYFSDLVSCLTAYATSPIFTSGKESMAMRAITGLKFCATKLAQGEVVPFDDMFTDQKDHKNAWSPVLEGLASAVFHENISVRSKAMKTFFKILNSYGRFFSLELWRYIFSDIISSLFEHVDSDSNFEELVTTPKALLNTVLLYCDFYDLLSPLLDEVLKVLVKCLSASETLATIAATSFETLIEGCYMKFSFGQWFLVLEILSDLLLKQGTFDSIKANDSYPKEKEAFFISRTRIQSFLLQLIMEKIVIMSYNNLQTEHIDMLIHILREFYSSITIMTSNEEYLPSYDPLFLNLLLKEESACLSVILSILFNLRKEENGERKQLGEDELISTCKTVIQAYLDVPIASDTTMVREAKVPVLVLILTKFIQFEDEQFLKQISVFYSELCQLIKSEDPNVRNILSELFEKWGKLQNLN